MEYMEWVVIHDALTKLMSNSLFLLLILLVVLDFITGTIKAFTMKDVSSSTGINGLLKHTTVVIVVSAMGLVTIIAGWEEIKYVFILFYIFEYTVSIIENLDKMGIPFPESVSKALRQWQEEKIKGGKK